VVTFLGDGPGTVAGMLPAAGATPVARWTGSGLRTGRVTFVLRAGAGPNIPIRFVLSAPRGRLSNFQLGSDLDSPVGVRSRISKLRGWPKDRDESKFEI
jgi:hypothetical protein